MIRTKIKAIAVLSTPALLLLVFAFAPASANSPAHGWEDRDHRCVHVGGTLITNFGALAPDAPTTTLGPATGDLAGAVAGTLIGAPQVSGNNVLFKVQHHWVTESGDTITFDQATATTVALSQSRFAVVNYPVHINGGTGKFAGATGDINAIGEVDLNAGTVFRYFGKVCFADTDNH
ncbi:MAG TPA: hypothetical protein VN780_00750 [Candidatus Eisenbacteria bacterium]|jgi:hypothetical protein|nr:hypothetical protein [Candidatus Eisenbacteria bacterium]